MKSGSFAFLAMLIVFILITWAVALWIRHAAKQHAPAAPDRHRVSGVGGWLLLLILGLMFLGPLMSVGRVNSDFMSAEASYPALKTLAVWSTYKTATWWVVLVVCALSFYAGLELVRKRTRRAVTWAQCTLWLVGPVASIVLGVVVPAIVLPTSNAGTQFLGALIASVIGAGIWSAYLSRSKRVAATYGERDGIGIVSWVFYLILPKSQK